MAELEPLSNSILQRLAVCKKYTERTIKDEKIEQKRSWLDFLIWYEDW